MWYGLKHTGMNYVVITEEKCADRTPAGVSDFFYAVKGNEFSNIYIQYDQRQLCLKKASHCSFVFVFMMKKKYSVPGEPWWSNSIQ
jgi:hypothetical protein